MLQIIAISIAFIHSISWALGQTEDMLRGQIFEVLSQRHPREDGNWWKSLGPFAPGLIMRLYAEENNIYRKIRLLDALAWYDEPRVGQFLKDELERSPNEVIRNSALNSLIRSQGMKEERYIVKVLDGGSFQMRLTAARALDDLDDLKATRLVDKFLSTNGNATLARRVISHRIQIDRNRVSAARRSSR